MKITVLGMVTSVILMIEKIIIIVMRITTIISMAILLTSLMIRMVIGVKFQATTAFKKKSTTEKNRKNERTGIREKIKSHKIERRGIREQKKKIRHQQSLVHMHHSFAYGQVTKERPGKFSSLWR